MRLAGGNPDDMDFPAFLDVSYALLAEEHQRINPLRDLLSVGQELSPISTKPMVRTTVAAQNEQSLAQLQARMAGVQRNTRRSK